VIRGKPVKPETRDLTEQAGRASNVIHVAGGEFTTTLDATQCDSWQTCQPGTYKVDGTATTDATCSACLEGKFTKTLDATQCDPWQTCPANQVTNFGSATTDSHCTDCYQGQYKSQTDNACSACAAGQYQNQTGQTVCKPCTEGEYQNDGGQGSCLVCATCPQHQDRQGCSASDAGACVPVLCIDGDITCVHGTISGSRPNCNSVCQDNWVELPVISQFLVHPTHALGRKINKDKKFTITFSQKRNFVNFYKNCGCSGEQRFIPPNHRDGRM